jgi:hypothetical protein
VIVHVRNVIATRKWRTFNECITEFGRLFGGFVSVIRGQPEFEMRVVRFDGAGLFP